MKLWPSDSVGLINEPDENVSFFIKQIPDRPVVSTGGRVVVAGFVCPNDLAHLFSFDVPG